MTRRKLLFTDAEGNIWSRYDKELYTVSIEEDTIVGMTKTEIIGNVPIEDQEYCLLDRLYMAKYPDEFITPDMVLSLDQAKEAKERHYDIWAASLYDAEQIVAMLKEKYGDIT